MALPFKKKTVQPGITMGGAEAPTGQPQASQTVSGTGQGNTSPSQGGGIFSNLRKYVDANKDTNLGQKIVDNTQKKADILTPQITTARDEVVRKLGEEQTRLNSATQTPPQQQQPATPQPTAPTIPTTQYGGLFGQVEQDPTKLDNSQIEQFKQIYGGNYAAPTTDLSGINPQVAALNDIAKNAGTEQGRYGLLQSNFGRPTYSTGQQRLDQLLLQNAPGQGKLLQSGTQNIANTQADALKGLNTQQTNAQDAIRTLAGTRQTEAQGLLGTEAIGEGKGTGLLGGMVDSLEQRTSDTQNKANKLNEVLSKAFGAGFGTQEEQQNALKIIQESGIDPSKINTYDIASQNDVPRDFLNKLNVSPEQMASKDESDRLKALYGLSGREQNFLTGEAPKTPFDLKSTLNTNRLQEIGDSRKSALNEQIVKSQGQAKNIEAIKGINDIIGDYKFGDQYEDQSNYKRLAAFQAIQNSNLPDTIKRELSGNAGLNTGQFGGQFGIEDRIKKLFGNYQQFNNEAAGYDQSSKSTLADLLNKYKSIPLQTDVTTIGNGGFKTL